MKKQQLNAMVKAHQRSTVRRQQCTKPTHKLAANDKACIADLLHDLRSNHPVLKTVQKRAAVSTVEESAPAAIPKVLSAFSAKYATYGPVLSALVNRATTAGLKAADVENAARLHNDHLSAVNSEFTRSINKQTALREMEAEKGARVASDKFRDVMQELTHVYNTIIVDHMRAVVRCSIFFYSWRFPLCAPAHYTAIFPSSSSFFFFFLFFAISFSPQCPVNSDPLPLSPFFSLLVSPALITNLIVLVHHIHSSSHLSPLLSVFLFS
jgi:hypothetical protein